MVQIRNVVYARGESGPFVKQLVIMKDEAEASEMLTAEEAERIARELSVRDAGFEQLLRDSGYTEVQTIT